MRFFKIRVMVLLLLLASPKPVPAQTNSAVSGFTGKIGYAGGLMNSYCGHNFDGSLAFPVTRQFGVQADGLYSRISDLNFYGGAGHLFWRDPGTGLLGLAGGYLYRDGSDAIDSFQVGAEGEYYLKRLTFSAFAGVGQINYSIPAPFIDTHPTRFVGQICASYYPMNNLVAGVSYASAFQDNLVKGNLEYQTCIRGLALTAEAALGNHGYDHLLFGIQYYFGADKSLRARHREDDPQGLMHQILYGLGLYGAEFNRKAAAFIADHPGSSYNSGGYGVVFQSVYPP